MTHADEGLQSISSAVIRPDARLLPLPLQTASRQQASHFHDLLDVQVKVRLNTVLVLLSGWSNPPELLTCTPAASPQNVMLKFSFLAQTQPGA